MLCFCVDWIDGISIGHDPLIYIEGVGLIPIENLSKPYFPSFSRVWNSSDRNPKGQIRTGFFVRYVGSPVRSSDFGRKSRLRSELPTVGTPDFCRNSRRRDNPRHPSRFLQASRKSRQPSELPIVGSPDLGRNSRQRGIFPRA